MDGKIVILWVSNRIFHVDFLALDLICAIMLGIFKLHVSQGSSMSEYVPM
jgi:hypothetical protein